MVEKRITLGLVEKVLIMSDKDSRELVARIDTGATASSIDTKLAEKLGLQYTDKFKVVKSASGSEKRPLVIVRVKIRNLVIEEIFNLADRSHMTYQVLIGQNILKKGDFLVDPNKEQENVGKNREKQTGADAK